MAQLDPRLILAGQPLDLIGSLTKGAKLAGAGREDAMTPYQKEMLALRKYELFQSPRLTPFQSSSLELRERELADRQAARAEPKSVSAVEGIRGKIARGEALTPGEQKVYDDATNLSAFDRFLLGGGQGSVGRTPAPSAPQSTGPLPEPPTDPTRRRIGQVYGLPDGRQVLWTQDGQGNVGWEPLN